MFLRDSEQLAAFSIEQAFCSRRNSHFEFRVKNICLIQLPLVVRNENSSRGESEMSVYGVMALPIFDRGRQSESLFGHVTCHSYTPLLILFFVS